MRTDRSFCERYVLDARLGAGAMGSVWRATQVALGRPVAIKFMSPQLVDEPQFRERFAAEARAVARLIHTHVTAVFDSGVAGGVPFLVTELVEGQPLSDLLAKPGELDAVTRMVIAGQILSGLEAIHALGIVHRDIKPSNVMVARAPQLTAKVLDFGIAKKLNEERGLTEVGAVLGSPPYMSPEQARGQKLSPASDLYALTIVIYEMVLGAPPFVGPNALSTIHMRLTHDAVVPGDLVPPLAELLRRGLSRDPELRITDTAEYRAALDRALAAVRETKAFTPGGHTQARAFAPQQPVTWTIKGTVAAEQPAPRAGAIGPRAGRDPWVAVGLILCLLAVASLAKRPHPAPVASAATSRPAEPPAPESTPEPAPSVQIVPGRAHPLLDRLRDRGIRQPLLPRRQLLQRK